MTSHDTLINKVSACYFKENLRLLLQVYSPHHSQEILESVFWMKHQFVELYFIKKHKIFFDLNEEGEFVKDSDICSATILGDRVLVLFCEQGIKMYPFESSFEMRKFLIAIEIDWVIGDQHIFMNPSYLAHIEHEPGKQLRVVLKNLIQLKFNQLQVPGRMLVDTHQLFVCIEAKKKRLPLTIVLPEAYVF